MRILARSIALKVGVVREVLSRIERYFLFELARIEEYCFSEEHAGPY
jgi:hypothetical protein